MTLSDAIASLGTQSFTRTRRSHQPLDSAGREQPRTNATATLVGSIQPLKGDDLERLPEGTRAADYVVVFSEAELTTANGGEGLDADLISYRGEQYEVESVEPWSVVGGYYRAVARKVSP